MQNQMNKRSTAFPVLYIMSERRQWSNTENLYRQENLFGSFIV